MFSSLPSWNLAFVLCCVVCLLVFFRVMYWLLIYSAPHTFHWSTSFLALTLGLLLHSISTPLMFSLSVSVSCHVMSCHVMSFFCLLSFGFVAILPAHVFQSSVVLIPRLSRFGFCCDLTGNFCPINVRRRRIIRCCSSG